MTTENPPETWIPLTPPSHNHPAVGAADSSVTALAAAVNSNQIGVNATQHQSEGKEDICKGKTELKKKERKKRGHRGKIFLSAFERTLKPKTPKLKPKRKYTKKKLDKSSIVLPTELIIAKDLLGLEITVANEKPLITKTYSRRSKLKPLITKTYSRRSKLSESAKCKLDLNLDCQLEVEDCRDSVANEKPLV